MPQQSKQRLGAIGAGGRPPEGPSPAREPNWHGLTMTHAVSFINTAVAAVIVVTGWYFTSSANLEHDRIKRQEDLRLAYIGDAWKMIEAATNRPPTPERIANFDAAIAQIQLYGNDAELAGVNHLIDTFEASKKAGGLVRGDTLPLMTALRDSLRAQVNLPPIKTPPTHFIPEGGYE